jgi:transcriptional antiterminator RfaH
VATVIVRKLDEDRDADLRWYVAYAQPGRERLAVAHLSRQGFVTYLPQIRRVISHARRTQEVLRPLFPRYVFLRLSLGVQRWRPVLGTTGVSTLIMDGERPRAVSHGIIETFLAADDGAGGFDFAGRLKPGGGVQFVSGPLLGALGQLVSMGEGDRVKVLLDLLGSFRVVEADARELAPA